LTAPSLLHSIFWAEGYRLDSNGITGPTPHAKRLAEEVSRLRDILDQIAVHSTLGPKAECLLGCKEVVSLAKQGLDYQAFERMPKPEDPF